MHVGLLSHISPHLGTSPPTHLDPGLRTLFVQPRFPFPIPQAMSRFSNTLARLPEEDGHTNLAIDLFPLQLI
jgi:hypothetical protein